MLFGKDYNVNDLPKSSDAPVEAGTYNVDIIKAEIKDSAKGGNYLNLQYKITGPKYAGRFLFDTITLNNNNQQAVDIGLQNLRDLMEGCGLSVLNDTDQLQGKSLSVKINVKDNNDGYGPRNNVLKRAKPTGMAAPASPMQSAPQPAAKPARPF